MIHNILDNCKDIFIDSMNKLKFSDRCIALRKVSKAIGKGSQRTVAKVFNVSRDTIRKGTFYHSKYNPVERVWGVLEKHWNGDILDSTETTLKFAGTMTWKGKNPVIDLVEKVHETDKTVKKEAMKIYEQMIERSNFIIHKIILKWRDYFYEKKNFFAFGTGYDNFINASRLCF